VVSAVLSSWSTISIQRSSSISDRGVLIRSLIGLDSRHQALRVRLRVTPIAACLTPPLRTPIALTHLQEPWIGFHNDFPAAAGAELDPEVARERAIASFSQMVGAMALSRAIAQAAPGLSDEILAANRSQLTQQ
jgi:hypothetical protein